MSSINLTFGSERDLTLQTIAKALAILFPIIGVGGLVGTYVLGFRSLSILTLYVAVPSVLAPLLYLYASDVGTETLRESPQTSRLLLTGYFLLQATAVFLLATNPVRPYSYYAVIAALAVVILVQILWFSQRRWLLLGQIVFLHLNLVWGVTLKYNYFIGRTDILGHVQYIELIIGNQGIPPALGGFYQSFPLWHLLGAMQNLLFGGQVSPRTTVYIISGLLSASVPIVVYLVATRLFDSPAVALVAALLTALDGTVVHAGMYSIPRSAASFLFVFMLLAWVRNGSRSVVLFSLFALAIAGFHTVSLPFIFIILTIDYLFRQYGVPLLSDSAIPGRLGASYLLLSVVVLVQAAYWLFFADYLVEHIVSVVFQQSPPGQVNTGVFAQPFRELANYISMSAILVFIFVGVLTGLADNRVSGRTKATLLSALVFVGLSFPGPQLLIGRVAESFNVLRFGQYTFPFIMMAAAYGLVTVVRGARNRGLSGKTVAVGALAVFIIFSGATISNDFVASDNPVVERQFYTNYISEAEEESLQRVAAVTAGNVSADYVGTRYFGASTYEDKAQILGVSSDRRQLYFGSANDSVLIRDRELQRRPLQVWITDFYEQDVGYLGGLDYVNRDAPVWSRLRLADKTYDSGVASAYQRSVVIAADGTANTTAGTG